MTDRELIRAAFAVRERAYTPYSHFKVGAALLTRSGRVFTGCNIENASFSPTICAERAALAAAVSAGEREFDAIAIVGSMEGKVNTLPTSPCGVCRHAGHSCQKRGGLPGTDAGPAAAAGLRPGQRGTLTPAGLTNRCPSVILVGPFPHGERRQAIRQFIR